MQYAVIPLIAILLFYADTLINSLMPIQLFGYDFYFTSHVLFLYLLTIAVYKNPTIALILGVFFGLISDIYLGTVYGIYTFSYILFIMLMNQLFKVFYKDLTVMIGLMLSFIVLFELVFFIIHITLTDSTMNFAQFAAFHALPTLVMNFILIILIFPVILRVLERSYK